MKHLLLAGLIIPAITAHAAPTFTARDLANECREWRDDADMSQPARACVLIITGYLTGFRAGAGRGLSTAFVHDAQSLATIKGIADLRARITAVAPRAACMPVATTPRQVSDLYVHYIDTHPAVASGEFATPLLDTIESYFCPE